MGPMAKPTQQLTTVENAFALIRVLADSGPAGARVGRLCAETGLPRRTVYRYLSTLIDLGMIEPTGEQSYAYRLGPAVNELARSASRQREFLNQAAGFVKTLALATGKVIHCTVFDQGSVVTVAVAPGDQTDKTGNSDLAVLGSRRPAHATASGKLFLAHQPGAVDAYVTRELAAWTPRTITDPQVLREQCAQAVKLGYAVDNHEYVVGICCVAVPVWGEHKRVVGALSASWRTQDEAQVAPDFLRQMKAAAREFSQLIGGEPK